MVTDNFYFAFQLQTAEASEETILGKLSAFNSTIRYLSTAVDAVETEKKASITSSLNEAQTNIQKAINTKKEIQAYLIQINKLIGKVEWKVNIYITYFILVLAIIFQNIYDFPMTYYDF